MSYNTARVTIPFFMGSTEFFSAPFCMVTSAAVS
jgi:hypothetical protein